MKFLEALTYLFKGLLFIDGHLTQGALDVELQKECSAGGCG